MGFLLDSVPTEVDQVLCAATHEAGHAVAFRKAGVRVMELKVWETKKHTASGVCQVDSAKIPDLGAYLVSILAGDVAEARWLTRYYGHSKHSARRELDLAGGSTTDLKRFHEMATGQFREGKIRRQAESLVWWNWGRIERLGKKLARKRRLPGSAV